MHLFPFQDGITALIVASSLGKPSFVSILIEAGADIHAEDEDKCMPLHVASREGNADVAHILLQAGANVACKMIIMALLIYDMLWDIMITFIIG